MIQLTLVLTSLVAQAPAADPNSEKLDQAVQAAQKAAEAAEKAAEAAKTAAEAAQATAKSAAAAPAPVATAPAGAPPPAEAKPEGWKGLVGVGLIALTGNAETLTGTANAQADRNFGPWGLGIRLNGAYGQTTPQDGGAAQLT